MATYLAVGISQTQLCDVDIMIHSVLNTGNVEFIFKSSGPRGEEDITVAVESLAKLFTDAARNARAGKFGAP